MTLAPRRHARRRCARAAAAPPRENETATKNKKWCDEFARIDYYGHATAPVRERLEGLESALGITPNFYPCIGGFRKR